MTLFLRYRYGVRISEHNFWRDAEFPTVIERHFAGILYVEFDGDRYLGYYLRTELLSINFIFSFFFLERCIRNKNYFQTISTGEK